MTNRRIFVKQCMGTAGALLLQPTLNAAGFKAPQLKISLAQWSLHRMMKAGKLLNLDFPAKVRKDFNIGAVEYVNQFFGDRKMDYKVAASNKTYLSQLLTRSKDAGIYNHLIMVDDEGPLALPHDKE